MRKYLLLVPFLLLPSILGVLIQQRWSGQRALNTPSSPESAPNCFIVDLQFLGPRAYAHRFSLKSEVAICSLVSMLFYIRRPPAITGLVIAIIIRIAINGFTLGSLSHVGQKVREVQPLLADSDPSLPVVVVFIIVGVCTSLDHVIPGLIGSIAISVLAHPVLIDTFTPNALAGLRGATFQMIYSSAEFRSATTQTFPESVSSDGFFSTDSGNTSKDLTCNIFVFFQNSFRIVVNHVVHSLGSVNNLIRAVRVFKHSFGSFYFNTEELASL